MYIYSQRVLDDDKKDKKDNNDKNIINNKNKKVRKNNGCMAKNYGFLYCYMLYF